MRDEIRGTKRLRDQLDWERQQKEKAHNVVKNLERVCAEQDRLQVDHRERALDIAKKHAEESKQITAKAHVMADAAKKRAEEAKAMKAKAHQNLAKKFKRVCAEQTLLQADQREEAQNIAKKHAEEAKQIKAKAHVMVDAANKRAE